MLNDADKAAVASLLEALYLSFPNGKLAPQAAFYMVEDVSEYSMVAIDETIRAFRRGEVAGRNHAFPPSVPEFVAEARARNERMQVEEFWSKTIFIEADSAEWRAICERRGGSMPRIERKGVTGWYVPKDEVERVPTQTIENYRALLEHRQPLPVVPRLQRMNDHG